MLIILHIQKKNTIAQVPNLLKMAHFVKYIKNK